MSASAVAAGEDTSRGYFALDGLVRGVSFKGFDLKKGTQDTMAANFGGMADAFSIYAQPLLDDTDGSIEQANHALQLAQLCWNLALLPEAERNASLAGMGAPGDGR